VLKRLFGRFVLLVVVVLGLWFVVSHYHGNEQFGCQISLSAAGAGDDCPATLGQAAGDAQWAAARISTIADDPMTTGLLYDQDGHEEKIESGESGSGYEQALGYLSTYSGAVIADQPRGKQAAGHVEPKAAALIRTADQRAGVLVINNPAGPCPYASGIGCGRAMRLILPIGSTIVVWWPGGQHGSFEGTAR
jgi:hypothetical protein